MRFNHVTYSALLSLAYHALPSSSAPSPQGWTFIQKGESGIVALEAIVVSPTLVVTFDRAQHNPLMIDGHNAWAALWNLETMTATPLNATTDTFCASGSILSNGTMVRRSNSNIYATYSFVELCAVKVCPLIRQSILRSPCLHLSVDILLGLIS